MSGSLSAPASASSPSHRFLPLMLVLFVGSGCAALIYEIVWLQMLQLVIGGNASALGVLLGTFMGGMCLGSLLLPRLIPSDAHPLRVYALLEVGIAVCGVVILYAMPSIEHLYTSFGQHTWLRGVVAAICLLPPTVLMGATLPAVARWVESTPRGVSWLGFFYGGNIVGAVIGCLLAGFVLLPGWDMAVATWCAVAINAAVAGLAVLLSLISPYAAVPSSKEAIEWDESAMPIYVVTCLSGLCSLGAEVVWTRLLSLQFGGTVYTFSIILGIFLMGLGIGSSVASLVARTVASPRIALGVCQMLLTLAIAWSAYMISCSMPFWPLSPDIAISQWYTFQLDMARTVWCILPAACLWGASFPLALAAAAGPGKEPGRLVGGLYAVNTIGAIIGSLAFALWLIPALGIQDAQQLADAKVITFGTQNAQRILIGISFLSALVAWLPFGSRRRSEATGEVVHTSGGGEQLAWWVAAAAVCAIPAYFLITTVQPIPWGLGAEGRFVASKSGYTSNELALDDGIVTAAEIKDKVFRSGVDEKGRPNPHEYCLYMGEGLNVTVAVTESIEYNHNRSFHGGGKVQASTDPADMRLQRMLGHIPALVHPNPKSVLVVACGAGVTAGSFIPHPEVEEIVICDIEPLVPNVVTPFFSDANFNVVGRYRDGKVTDKDFIKSGRVKVNIDDGRHFIRTLPKDRKFDIITSDPIDPWVKGCAALNTVEYYQMCRDHLNPGGVMALWMPIYESNEETLKSVIGTFFQVFPNGILWTNDVNKKGYDAILFATVEPTKIDLDAVQARLSRPEQKPVVDSMHEVGYHSIFELFGTYAGDAQRMTNWTDGAKINTDRNLKLQYLAGMSLNYYIEAQLLEGILKHYEFPSDVFSGSEENIKQLERVLESNGRRGQAEQ